MAHARQELALRHVGRLRLGGPLLERLHQADPLHGDRHLVGDGADQPQVLFGERLPLHGTEGKGADHAALVQQRTAGVSPDAELADQIGPRLDRGLDVLGRNARRIASSAPADVRAVFEPLDLAGGLRRDAFGGVQPQLVLLRVHEVVEKDLAVEMFHHAAAKRIDDLLRPVAGQQLAADFGEQFQPLDGPPHGLLGRFSCVTSWKVTTTPSMRLSRVR